MKRRLQDQNTYEFDFANDRDTHGFDFAKDRKFGAHMDLILRKIGRSGPPAKPPLLPALLSFAWWNVWAQCMLLHCRMAWFGGCILY